LVQKTRSYNVDEIDYSTVGGLGLDSTPLICGGHNNDNCYLYDSNGWNQTHTMILSKRISASSSKSPFQDTSLLIMGGKNLQQVLNDTAEILNKTEWIQITSYPLAIMEHCMVTIDSTTVMAIGGYTTSLPCSTNTFYFNINSRLWKEGPKLNTSRHSHSCGLIRKTGQVYNCNGDLLHSVEILDVGATEWRDGPELSFGICDTQLIEGISPTILNIFDNNHKKQPTPTL